MQVVHLRSCGDKRRQLAYHLQVRYYRLSLEPCEKRKANNQPPIFDKLLRHALDQFGMRRNRSYPLLQEANLYQLCQWLMMCWQRMGRSSCAQRDQSHQKVLMRRTAMKTDSLRNWEVAELLTA